MRHAAGLLLLVLAWHCGLAMAADGTVRVATAGEQPYLNRFYLLVDSPEIQDYLDGVVRRLLAAGGSKLNPAILVFSSDEFTASSDDRNNILISTRTLRELESEDELAALLGHELAHLQRGHNQRKGAMRSFPAGVETAGWLAAAADQLSGRGRTSAGNGSLSDFSKGALVNTQAVGLLWSDILTPAWNRGQEREADRGSYDLMVAAGYDPAAFGALFSKLQSASARRSERMELLKRVAQSRLQASAAREAANKGKLGQIGTRVKGKAEEVSVDAVFDQLTRFTRDYDRPEQRQKLIAEYADRKSAGGRDKTPRSPRFRQGLREGRGGALLAADRNALRLLSSLSAGKVEEARRLVGAVRSSPGGEPLSPHLNLALGTWYGAVNDRAAGEQRVQAWLRAKRPPAQAYLWRAAYQWDRKEYAQVKTTLESGSKRIGSAGQFLPFLVSAAKATGNERLAEDYTRRCRDEDRKGANALFTMITFRGGVAPSGIYPECVRRLGHEPAENGLGTKVIQAPVKAGKAVASKARELLRRH